MKRILLTVIALFLLSSTLLAFNHDDDDDAQSRKEIPISTGKRLITPVPGAPRSTNSLPMTIAVSPNKKWMAILNAGYGTKESGYKQSIAILNTETDELRDFPDDRLGQKAKQSYFVGLAWSNDGEHIYASIASISDPEGVEKGSTGNGIAVYTFRDGTVTPERFMKIPMQSAPPGRRATKVDKAWPAGKTACYPAGIAVPSTQFVKQERIIVACNLSDSVLVLNAASGTTEHVFDVSDSATIPASYPYAIVTSNDGRQAWLSLWNSSRVVELHIADAMRVVRTIDIHRPKDAVRAGSHPTALALSGGWLYVALSSTDEVAAVDAASGKVKKFVSIRMSGQHERGSYPSALAVLPWPNPRLFVAASSSNAVAHISVTGTDAPLVCPDKCNNGHGHMPSPRMMSLRVEGYIPTEWYPIALA